MQIRSYNKEIVIATRMFIDVFNDIVIDRRDNLDNIIKEFSVPCVYGARSRILKSFENRGATLRLPMLAVTITGITRDESRAHSVNSILELQPDGHFDMRQQVANPININFQVSVLAKYQEDLDQIMSNFIPFFNPDIYVTWPHPYDESLIKSQIVWGGDMSVTYPEEITETDPWRIMAEADFTFKTWMFAGMGTGRQPEDQPLIYNINLCKGMPDGNYTSGYNNGELVISGSIDVGAMNAWYEVPTFMEFADYVDNIEAGYIKAPNFDSFHISGTLFNPGSYWQSTSGLLSGELLNPNDKDDLAILIDNFDNPDLDLVAIAGTLTEAMSGVDFLPIWQSQLSGALSDCIL